MVFEVFKYQMKQMKEGSQEENTRKKVFPVNAQINITGYDTETQQHQLELHLDQLESPPSSATTPMRHRWIDLSKIDVRMFQPGVAVVLPAGAPTLAHTDTAHTVNDTARTDAPPYIPILRLPPTPPPLSSAPLRRHLKVSAL